MQRLAPSLMPATRYVSKQLADWSVLDRRARPPIEGGRGEGGPARKTRFYAPCGATGAGEPPGIGGARAIEQGYPIRAAHQERSRSRVLTASLLWHKQHTMPEPAFALFFFFFTSQFRHISPASYGCCGVLGLKKLPFLSLYIVSISVKVARHYTRR